ncbi:hypothetical protein I4U23_020174 [Adineta vaga]|nr:hypothetical protein I4U23_020174 [Adineta vaga]
MATGNRSIAQRRKLALIISNGNYSKKENEINDSVQNGKRLKYLLKAIGFEIVKHKKNVFVKQDMMLEVKKFADMANKEDLVLFYYCGHCCQVGQINYLIHVNDDNIEMNTIEDYGTDAGRMLDRLVDRQEQDTIPSYATIFILDCCKPYQLKDGTKSSARTQSKGLYEMQASDGVLIQFSCEPKKTVRNNLFVEYLLENITQENVHIVDVFQNIRDDVCRASEGQQQPFLIYQLQHPEDIYLYTKLFSTVKLPQNAKWQSTARTIAGGDQYNSGPDSTLDKLHCPRGLSFTPKQAILIADTLNHRIIKYRQDEIVGQKIVGENIPDHKNKTLCSPTNMIFHEQSRSYIICDYQNRRVLQWFRRKGAHLEVLWKNIACFGIAADHEGFIYISDTENHEVRRYSDPTKRGVRVAGGDGKGNSLHQLNHPTYIYVDLDKTVYVSDSWNNRVMKWKNRARSGVIVAGGNGYGNDRTQLDCPAGLVIDQWGSVYVADHWNHRVMRWRNGATEGDIIINNKHLARNDPDQLNGPEGLAFDEDGHLYVADCYNHRIQQFEIEAN